jgi:hypothetical protein
MESEAARRALYGKTPTDVVNEFGLPEGGPARPGVTYGMGLGDYKCPGLLCHFTFADGRLSPWSAAVKGSSGGRVVVAVFIGKRAD